MIEQSAISGRNFASEDTINSWIQDIKDTFKFVNYAKLYKFIFSNYSGDGESPVDGDEGMGYLNRVVDGLKALCGVTGIEVAAQLLLVIKEQMELEDYLSNKCLLVKAELERVERDMMAMKGSDVEWRFEPLIEAWVEKTPERKLAITNQQQRMQDNSNDSDDSESQSDEEIVSLPSSPLSRRNLRDPKATNSSTLSSKNGTNTRKHTMQSTDTRIAKRRHTQTDIDIEKSIAKENVGNDFEKKWRFEPIIGEWVERTPEKAKKIVRRVSDVY
ncbi:hypothetical protein HK098_008300 [Nowakowskiella sp. JEL0407]|nr:hypothetical protein HK098_008300 [Nowakowskiella sp. JEL0407]